MVFVISEVFLQGLLVVLIGCVFVYLKNFCWILPFIFKRAPCLCYFEVLVIDMLSYGKSDLFVLFVVVFALSVSVGFASFSVQFFPCIS